MNDEVNQRLRATMDQTASAVQVLVRVFQIGRTAPAMRNDLESAKERLRAAMAAVDDAIRLVG